MTIHEATTRLAALGGTLFHSISRCSCSPLRRVVSRHTGLILLTLLVPGMANAASIVLDSDTQTATAGNFQLSWQADGPSSEFILYESTSEDFSTATMLYRGADLARVISGKPDGEYYYRVVDATDAGIMSDTVMVEVKHHPLAVAFSFFAIGAVVFVATLVLILSGNRKAE